MTQQNQNVLQVIVDNEPTPTLYQIYDLVALAKSLNINPHAIVEQYLAACNNDYHQGEYRLLYDRVALEQSNNDYVVYLQLGYSFTDSDLNLLSQDAELDCLSYDINNYTITLS